MVATASLERELASRGFRHLPRWPRGVDTDLFRPERRMDLDVPRPIFLYVGRVAVEKSLDAFLSADLPGSKVVVGNGPARERLARSYPNAHFLGARQGKALAATYAYPVPGPRDVLGVRPDCGALDDDIAVAGLNALHCDGAACRDYAMTFTSRESARMFVQNVRSVAHRVRGTSSKAGWLRRA